MPVEEKTKVTPSAIAWALETIRETCNQHFDEHACLCGDGCPLKTSDQNCGLRKDVPCDWKINKPGTYKAF